MVARTSTAGSEETSRATGLFPLPGAIERRISFPPTETSTSSPAESLFDEAHPLGMETVSVDEPWRMSFLLMEEEKEVEYKNIFFSISYTLKNISFQAAPYPEVELVEGNSGAGRNIDCVLAELRERHDAVKDSDVVTQAEAFAACCHAGQTRKDGVTPYITHPAEVVATLR